MAQGKRKTKPARKMTAAEQHAEFIKTARELGISDTEAAQERAFGKVGMSKPKRRSARKSKGRR